MKAFGHFELTREKVVVLQVRAPPRACAAAERDGVTCSVDGRGIAVLRKSAGRNRRVAGVGRIRQDGAGIFLFRMLRRSAPAPAAAERAVLARSCNKPTTCSIPLRVSENGPNRRTPGGEVDIVAMVAMVQHRHVHASNSHAKRGARESWCKRKLTSAPPRQPTPARWSLHLRGARAPPTCR